jgi:uncharacterized protein involved in exopolysaccharide biosynthesis
LVSFGKEEKPLGDWDAIREARRALEVKVDRRSGTITISFDTPSPSGSAEIVQHYLNEAKNRLQEEALAHANNNKLFIEKQINNTVDPLIRDRLFSLYSQEVEKEMLAKNREQFGFTIIDSPKTPDRTYRPRRVTGSLALALLSFVVASSYYLFRSEVGVGKS